MKANLSPFTSLVEPAQSSLGLDQCPHAREVTRYPLALATDNYWCAGTSGEAFGPFPIPGFTMSNRESGTFPGQPDSTGTRSGVVNGVRRCPHLFLWNRYVSVPLTNILFLTYKNAG